MPGGTTRGRRRTADLPLQRTNRERGDGGHHRLLGRLGSSWIRERALHVEELRLAGGQDGVLVSEILVDDLRREATHPGDDLDGEQLPQPEREPAIAWVAERERSRRLLEVSVEEPAREDAEGSIGQRG